MGRKKISGSATEEVGGEAAAALPKKNKKKGQLLVDDDEYMVVDQLDDDDSVKSGQQHSSSNGKQDVSHETESDLVASFENMGMSQKKKTKGKKFEPDLDDAGSEISVADEGPAVSKKGKKGKKGPQVEDDEYDVSAFDDAKSVQSTESSHSRAGSRKGKKFEPDLDDAGSEISVADDGPAVSKKGKKGKKGPQVEDDEYDVSAFDDAKSVQSTESSHSRAGSRKGKKGTQNVDVEDDVVEPPPSLSQEVAQAKKKNRKGKSSKKESNENDTVHEYLDTKKEQQDEEDDILYDLDANVANKTNKQVTSAKPDGDAVFSVLGEMEGSDDASEVENHSETEYMQGMSSRELGRESKLSNEVPFFGKKKSKKGGKDVKAGMDDVDVVPLEMNDGVDDLSVGDLVFSGKNKDERKKSSTPTENESESSFAVLDNHTLSLKDSSVQEEELEVEDFLVFSGKKKSRKGKDIRKVAEDETILETSSTVEDLGNQADWLKVTSVEEEYQDLEVEEPLIFSGKKKSKKGKETRRVASKEAISRPSEEVEYAKDALDTDSLSVSSEKKKGKDKKGAKLFLDEDLDVNYEIPDMTTTGDSELLPRVGDESQPPALVEGEEIQFTGKKKGKKGKKSDKLSEDLDIEALQVDLDASKIHRESKPAPSEEDGCDVVSVSHSEDSLVVSKNKPKKGKKSGRTAQEEEDLDAILAELDGPKTVKQPEVISPELNRDATESAADGILSTADVIVSTQPIVLTEGDGAEAVESAASKKKKKKKEREKEKAKVMVGDRQMDQVDAEVSEEKQEASTKGKVVDKKVPKHIREMQERLAKQREAEEKRKREEEEKRRKEEEEQRRLEELEREKEEAKRRRKEREKEKLLKKKQEGKLLTGKQKEEARRLALMREQLLAQKGTAELDTVSKEDAAPKKPKYENKKKRRPHGGEAVSSIEQQVEEHDIQPVQESPMEIELAGEKELEKEPEIEPEAEAPQEESEVEEEIDEDWDAKSWDSEVKLPAIKSAFAEEEDGLAGSKKAAKRAAMEPSNDSPPVKRSGSPQKAAAQKLSNASTKANTIVQGSDNETESEDESDSDEENDEMRRRREAAHKREARTAEAFAKRSAADLRSPICCILGHVDTGKTKLLDCIRRTNVQEGEAGGITQQIGATYFPMENIQERTKELKSEAAVRVPGLLVIDTPGHESFTNLRARGSGLCDIAILVIDIMHGLEPQTLESLNLLKMRHTPFVVALNKVDRLYNWKTVPNAPIRGAFKLQSKDVTNEFEMRLSQIMTELKEQGLNSELYFKNKEIRKFVSIVPTSAISGEGVPDLLMLLVHLTQKMMEDKLMYISEVQCTVLEVKVVEGLGTTIDVILVNGVLHEGDQIVVCGMQGPIVTNIRALLTPHPMKELRVKGSYQHHKELKAAQGIKLTAQGLEHAIAGTQLYVIGPEDDLEDVKVEAMQDMKNVMSRVDKSGEGVCVQASTLGSLEALLEFLKSPAVKIPVSGINIGPVHKRDVMRASVMLERKKKEYATILAFDVKVTPEAKELAEELGVRIFMADIIYHLFDQFTAYMNNIKEEKRQEVSDEAVFPCVLSIKPQFVFNKKDPIIIGVDVLEGIAKVGTPLCVPSKEMIDIGRIASMEVNHKVVDIAKKGQAVAMKIVGSTPEETQKMFGRHFDHEDELVSHITRRSIDVLKENFRDELSVEEWKLVVKLKKLFNIP